MRKKKTKFSNATYIYRVQLNWQSTMSDILIKHNNENDKLAQLTVKWFSQKTVQNKLSECKKVLESVKEYYL